MNRIDREKKTVQKMIEIYCRHHLKQTTIPEEYQQLIAYAHNRLSHCRFGENKNVCKKCPIHCYVRNVPFTAMLQKSVSRFVK